MHSAEQVFQIIQSLPPAERRHLIERLAGELAKATPAEARKPKAEPPGSELVGFLADDPDLADELCRIATIEREEADEARPDAAAVAVSFGTQGWEERMKALLDRVDQRTAGLDADDVEAEITRASGEARELARILDASRTSEGDLSDDDALALAVEEVRAHRAERLRRARAEASNLVSGDQDGLSLGSSRDPLRRPGGMPRDAPEGSER
jgi:hypothetical protein